jgi:hypothetical protein
MITDNDPTLTARDVLGRLKTRNSSHYLDLYNIMKGVTLAAAGVSLLEIAVRHWATGRLLLWIVALAASVLTYYAATVGAALLNQRPTTPDILFPMLLSISELMLIYRPGLGIDAKAEWAPTDWFALLALWCFQCGFVIVFISRSLRVGRKRNMYDKNLVSTVDAYHTRLRVDSRMAFGSGIISLIAFLGWHLHLIYDGNWAKGGVALMMLGFIIGGIYSQQESSHKMDGHLATALSTELNECSLDVVTAELKPVAAQHDGSHV